MESWKIKDKILEFDPETHTYLVEGIIVPSVTQMMKPNFADMYSGIDKEILNTAARRGTEIHKWIEEYCQDGKHSEEREVKDFAFLKKHYELVEKYMPGDWICCWYSVKMKWRLPISRPHHP